MVEQGVKAITVVELEVLVAVWHFVAVFVTVSLAVFVDVLVIV